MSLNFGCCLKSTLNSETFQNYYSILDCVKNTFEIWNKLLKKLYLPLLKQNVAVIKYSWTLGHAWQNKNGE